MDNEDLYPCIGICTVDPDSGYCQGCGRPPPATPESVAEFEQSVVAAPPESAAPDTPE